MERAEVVRGQPLVNPERLIEDLTEREREVARLLAFGLGNGEIAATLFVSRNTVKTHLKHIYEKLAVRTRTEAVARCIELGLLRGAAGDDEQRAVLAVDFVDAGSDPRFRQPDALRIVRASPAGGGVSSDGPDPSPASPQSSKWVTRNTGPPSTFEPSGRRGNESPASSPDENGSSGGEARLRGATVRVAERSTRRRRPRRRTIPKTERSSA